MSDPNRVVYHPMELPANTDLARSVANQVEVDPNVHMSERRQAAAVDTILEYGTPDDPRLPGDSGGPPDPQPGPGDEPSVTGVDPASGNNGTTITLTGTALTGTTNVKVDSTWQCTNVTVVSDIEVTAVTPAGPKKGLDPIIVTVNGVDITGPSFQVT